MHARTASLKTGPCCTQRQWCIFAPYEIMVANAILLEKVTHELSGDMTHDPTKIQKDINEW